MNSGVDITRLPKRCECGGKMLYSRGAGGYIGSCCDRCTPVVVVRMHRDEEDSRG
jgi:phage FluMu protein Com